MSIHPGAVYTDLTTTVAFRYRVMVNIFFFFTGVSFMEQDEGRLSQLWAAAGAKKEDLVNGAFYMPIGRMSNDRLDKTAKSEEVAKDLWIYTVDILAKF
jgi:hypothetical protein